MGRAVQKITIGRFNRGTSQIAKEVFSERLHLS